MSKKITVEVNNESIFKDKNYIPYISRSDARRKGIQRAVEPVHAMEPHIRAMAPGNTLLGHRTQIHTRGTKSPYNKKGRLVRREYHDTLKGNIVKVIKKFITENDIKTKVTKRTAKPNTVISHKLETPIIRGNKVQRFIAMALTGNMFKRVIKRDI